VRNTVLSLGLMAALIIPAAAIAGTIDASLIPDGTYTVKVQKVVDSKHIFVAMDNGSQATLAAGRPTVDFGKVSAGDSLKVSTSKGTVLVFLDLGK
jgi:dihydroxyacetone kinase DhaKLM complex PTS-EIIA-like component DhaM